MSGLPFEDYEIFISMRTKEKRNAFKWSDCSVEDIGKFVPTALCLFNIPTINTFPLLRWAELTKNAPTLRQQCFAHMTVKPGDISMFVFQTVTNRNFFIFLFSFINSI